jgi:hypothetical protein
MRQMKAVKRFRAWLGSRDYGRLERAAVRLIVPLALLGSLVIAALLSVPHKLPSAAMGSRWVLYGLWSLAIFYGFLLLFLPLVRAMRGQLPIELSLRGPRYEEAAATTSDALKGLQEDLQTQKRLATALTESLQETVRRIAALEDAQGSSDLPQGQSGGAA